MKHLAICHLLQYCKQHVCHTQCCCATSNKLSDDSYLFKSFFAFFQCTKRWLIIPFDCFDPPQRVQSRTTPMSRLHQHRAGKCKKWTSAPPSSVKLTLSKTMRKIVGKSRPRSASCAARHPWYLSFCIVVDCCLNVVCEAFLFNTSSSIRFGFLVMLRKTNDYHDMEHSLSKKSQP